LSAHLTENKMTGMDKKRKLCMITLGCKANQYDSYAILGYLEKQFEIVEPSPQSLADLYVINACTVTHKADFDARQWLHRIRRWNPDAKVIVTGCLAETGQEQLEKENVELAFGPSKREKLVREITGEEPSLSNDIFYHPSGGVQSRARAMLKVQEGCDFRCSYCIVPYARGRSRSLDAEIVLGQISALRGRGFEEIVLCGINLGEWGKEKSLELPDLIDKIEGVGPGFRVRLSSLEPMAIDERLIETIARSKMICPHLHIPMQSGDDQVLKLMKRPYSSGEFFNLCEKLLEKIHGLCLGLDVIVGFPGEGERQFENTRDLLAKIPFGYLHIFKFSPREHTPAKKLRPKVPERTSRERARVLSKLDRIRRREFAFSQLGGKMEMIVEGRDRDWAYGHSGNYLYLKARTEKAVRQRVPVRLKEIKEELIAEEE